MDGGLVGRGVLGTVVDRTGRGGTRKVRSAFEEVERRLAANGHRLSRPVAAEIVSIPIMGATTSREDRHVLHVSARAAASDMLDGLIAHEIGHMLLTESGHPSHDRAVIGRAWRDLPFPRAARDVFGQAYNHVQDIYADDIAFLTGLEDRVYGFFAGWVRGNSDALAPSKWGNVGVSVTNGFALGNLVRHGRLEPADPLWSVARRFDEAAGLRAVDDFATYYGTLPTHPTAQRFDSAVRDLVHLLGDAADGTARRAPFNTGPGLTSRPRR